MTSSQLKELIRTDEFQVFLFVAPLPVPVNFTVHAWFVVNINGVIERWEFGKFKNSGNPKGVGILKNFISPTGGMKKYLWKTKRGSASRLVGMVSGNQESLAYSMAEFIRNETPNYPLQHFYRYLGPNSNTYAQWVIDRFPKSGFVLPSSAIGKNYKGKKYAMLREYHDTHQIAS